MKILFPNFCLFHFSKLKILCENLFHNGFLRFLWSSYVTSIFYLQIFDNERQAVSKVFEICTEIYFFSLFFLNERNIITLLLMIHLKCTVVHYAKAKNIKQNWKKPLLFRSEIGILKIFFKRLCEESFEDLQIVIAPLRRIRWSFKVFAKLRESHLLVLIQLKTQSQFWDNFRKLKVVEKS